SARQRERRLVQLILELVPKVCRFERRLYDVAELRLFAHPERARSVRDVVVYAHRKGIGALEYHPYALAQERYVRALVIDVDAAYLYLPVYPAPLDQVIHAIERFEQSRLAAAGRSYQCGDRSAPHLAI